MWGYTFRPGETASTIDADAAASWLDTAADDPDGFCWLHFSLANAATERRLAQHESLPPTFFEALHDSGGPYGFAIVVVFTTLTAIVAYAMLQRRGD